MAPPVRLTPAEKKAIADIQEIVNDIERARESAQTGQQRFNACYTRLRPLVRLLNNATRTRPKSQYPPAAQSVLERALALSGTVPRCT